MFYMSFTKFRSFKFSFQFKQLYSNFYINKFFWKIDPILNTSWKRDNNKIVLIKVQEIRSVRFWEKFRQGTNREQYRTGVHMINYLNLALFLGAYLRFYSSNINLSKLSLLTVFLTVLFFIPFRRIVNLKQLITTYNKLFIILMNMIKIFKKI